VRIVRGVLLAALLVWALAPELARYRAERLVRLGTEALRQVVRAPGEVADPAGALARIEQIALAAAGGLPGDPRPWILAGSSRLVAGDPAGALDRYRQARALGDRPEIDVNMGRAYESLGEPEKAGTAFLRALWISPALFATLLPDVQASLIQETHRLDEALRAGRLESPPPAPD
jgi:tetratricopeptide (TPR) repeat protein